MRHKKEWTPFSGKVSNRQRPVRFRSEKCDFQNETINNLFLKQDKLHSKTGKSTYFYKQRWFSSYLILGSCSMVLLLVLGCMINPFLPGGDEAYAAITEDLGSGASISLSIYNNGSEVANEGTVSTEVQSGQVSYISNMIKVNTTKIAKYYIGVQSATTSSSLTGQSTGVTIDGVGSNVAPGSFRDNTWGYALTDNTSTDDQNLTYSTLPAYSASTTPQYASANNPANGEHELKLTFAAKIRADKPADHYQAQALVSVAAEAKTITLSEITYMQDITPSICQDSDFNTQYTLTDRRDSSKYTVAKFKNQTDNKANCWMTKNLKLAGGMTLTSNDSDVVNGYEMTAAFTSMSTSDNPRRFSESDQYQSTTYRYTTEGGANEFIYNWYTATAGTGNASIANSNATGSICPKGWRLPTGGENGEFYALLDGLTYSIVNADPYSISAWIGMATGGMMVSVYDGYYWSSTVGADGKIYGIALLFTPKKVELSNTSNGTVGKSIRCVVR